MELSLSGHTGKEGFISHNSRQSKDEPIQKYSFSSRRFHTACSWTSVYMPISHLPTPLITDLCPVSTRQNNIEYET
jgi:hypothetical protein